MTNQVLPIVIGFLLTSVLGGLFGFYLQQRTWKHQTEQRLMEEELRRADELCQSLSQLLDKRLYRMLRLFFTVRATIEGRGAASAVTERLREYDAVLYEWNDQLNVNLAMIGAYFGEAARRWLDNEIYEGFKRVGGGLEGLVRRITTDSQVPPEELSKVEEGISRLNDRVYRLGLLMMTQLRDGRVGRRAPDLLGPERTRLDHGASLNGPW